jgi:hypothetical protein
VRSLNPDFSPQEVADRILKTATPGLLSKLRSGDPDLILYNGATEVYSLFQTMAGSGGYLASGAGGAGLTEMAGSVDTTSSEAYGVLWDLVGFADSSTALVSYADGLCLSMVRQNGEKNFHSVRRRLES